MTQTYARLKSIAKIAGAFAFVVGGLVLLGWLFDISLLKSVVPGTVSMKANTAACFVLVGVALWLLSTRTVIDQTGEKSVRRLIQVCAALVALIGLLTLMEYFFNWNLGIDQLLFKEPVGAIATSAPGRMSPNTAFNFFLLGIVLLFLEADPAARYHYLIETLTLTIGIVAALGLIGHLYGVASLTGLLQYTKMAVHTALTFLVLSAGPLCLHPDKGLLAILNGDNLGSVSARRMILAVIISPLVLGWVLLAGEKAALYDSAFALSLFVVLIISVACTVVLSSSVSLNRADSERHQAEEKVRLANAQIIAAAEALPAPVSDLFNGIAQYAASIAESSTSIAETTTTVEEVRQAAQLSSQKAQSVSDSAQRVAQVSRSGQEAVEDTAAGMDRIREQMETIAQTVVRLSEQSQSIGGIIASVTDLADQSNLLAVNAAIEAAKAGEQGRGFAVVAQEIKSLAEQSKLATAQVRGILSEVQKATSNAVMATEQGSKAVEAGVKQAAQAGDAIRVLAETSSEAVQSAIQIVASSQQQVVGMDQIGVAMESINQAGAQNASSMRQMEVAAQNLHELGEKLKELVAQFKV